MNKGTVKFFNDTKGYGFIIPEDPNEKDIFFHRSNVKNQHPILEEGKEVSYQEGEGKKGKEAKNIEFIEKS